MSGKNREGGKIEGELDEWLSTEMRCLNTGPNWIWSKMTLKGICHMRVVKVNLGMRSFEGHSRYFARQLPRSPGCAPWEDEWPAEHRRLLVSSHPASLTLSVVSVSASPARSPVFSHLSSSLQGLWTIRAYKAEQRFQELFDAHQDLHSGMWNSGNDFEGWDVLPSEAWPPSQAALPAHTSLCCTASPSVNLPPPPLPLSSPCVLPSPPCTPLLFFLTALHCPIVTTSCGFGPSRRVTTNLQKKTHIVSVATPQLRYYSTKAGKKNTATNGCDYLPRKLYLKKQTVSIVGP